MSNPKSQKGKGTSSPTKKSTCGKCGKKHMGECLVGTDKCFRCGKSGHKVMDFPIIKAKGKEGNQAQASGLSSVAPKKNRFYALRSRGDQEDSPNVLTIMLQVFSIIVYALLDTGATLSFVIPLVAKKFEMLLDILVEPFSVCTSMGDSDVVKKILGVVPYYCLIELC